MISAFLAAIGVYAAFVGALFAFQRGMMYLPSRERPEPAHYDVAALRTVAASTEDGLAIESLYRPAAPGRPTIVYFHGNAGHRGDRVGKTRPYLDAGYGVLLAGYRGYGGNPGQPTEDGLYADGRAALALLEGEGIAPARWVLYGESLGTGVAVQLGAERAGAGTPVGALVLEAPFTSMASAAQYHYPYVPAYWLVRDRFDSLAKIADVGAPLLIFHGGRDRTVPERLGRRLFAAAPEPKEALWIPEADHNDLYDFGAARAVLDFLGRRVAAGN